MTIVAMIERTLAIRVKGCSRSSRAIITIIPWDHRHDRVRAARSSSWIVVVIPWDHRRDPVGAARS